MYGKLLKKLRETRKTSPREMNVIMKILAVLPYGKKKEKNLLTSLLYHCVFVSIALLMSKHGHMLDHITCTI